MNDTSVMPKLQRTPRPTDPLAGQAIRQYVAGHTPGQAELARRLGIDPSALNRMLLGKGHTQSEHLTPAMASRIAHLVNAPREEEARWLSLLTSTRTTEAA